MVATIRFLVVLVVSLLIGSGSVAAQEKYGPGVTDTEIKIGQTQPYSGPASSYGTVGKAEAAYFQMINDQGGVNGRKINLISLDDGYSPPKTVEQVRRLIEQERVLLLFNNLGTPTNTAIHKYVNAQRVPHILLATGATKSFRVEVASGIRQMSAKIGSMPKPWQENAHLAPARLHRWRVSLT